MFAAQSIMLGHQDIVVAGGFESMSNVPYYVPKGRTGYRYGHGEFLDGLLKDGLTDAFDGLHMGNAGDHIAKLLGFTRQDQDDYATSSYKRAAKAHEVKLHLFLNGFYGFFLLLENFQFIIINFTILSLLSK
jgi:acetyl-CoA C-acetyltransferase